MQNSARQQFGEAPPFKAVFQVGFGGINIRRQLLLGPQVVERIFISRHQVFGVDTEPLTKSAGKLLRILMINTVILINPCQIAVIAPERLAIGAPETTQCPTRYFLARIPLALAVMQQTAGGEGLAHTQQQVFGQFEFVGAQGIGIPLGGLHVINRNESRLTTGGQAHILLFQFLVDQRAQRIDGGPLFFGIGLCYARIFQDAEDFIVITERHFAFAGGAGDRCGRYRVRGTGQGNMPFSGQQT